MIQNSLIIMLLFLSLFLEVTTVTIPLVFIVLLLWYCLTRSEWVFIGATICGMFLDMLLIKQIGMSSLFFVSILYCIFLYQKKFEIDSVIFIGIMLFLGGWFYLWLLGYSSGVFVGFITALIGICLFWVIGMLSINKKKEFISL